MKRTIIIFSFLLIALLTGCQAMDIAYDESYKNGYVTSTLGGANYLAEASGEEYNEYVENQFTMTDDMPVSTFSTDVDTASYSNVRRYLEDGMLPPDLAVRVEEMINYFDYDLAAPGSGEAIQITTELGSAPWNTDHQLVMIGLKTEEIVYDETMPNNLVFLIDVSGSMGSSDKLPLLKNAMKLLVDELRPSDTISIVVYSGSAGVVLNGGDSTDKQAIIDAIDSLHAGGSTAGGEGIELAYQIALQHFSEDGNNRVILGTDGDFNVGINDPDELEEFISEKRETGVYLSVMGFGTGNLKDDTMERLADCGNGIYFYIDSMQEAEKVLVHELSGTLITVAKDVKLQIEFNPLNVKAYRLIGYENRILNTEDFEDDATDAGDMGSGHEVIAFYEIIPADSEETYASQEFEIPEDLRYDGENLPEELLSVSIRYKNPDSDVSELIESFVNVSDYTDTPGETFRFAASVAEFGLLLIGSEYIHEGDFDDVLARAEGALGTDEYGYREEFLSLVRIAKNLMEE